MKGFAHFNATTLDQAVAALVKYEGKARLNAGGTDLMGLLKDEFLPEFPEAVVNLKTIKGLDYIREEDGVLRIGALVKLSDLAHFPAVRERYPALAEAAHAVASPQIRNVATIGGNLCQDVRCCYYRYPRHIGGPINCARKGNGPCVAVRGDNRYHAIMQGRKCFAVCPSDTAVALAAFDARLVVVGPAGERRIAVTDFFHALGNALGRDEVVREIEVPAFDPSARQIFQKYSLRRPVDFAVVSVTALIVEVDGVCSDARIVLGAVAPGVCRAVAAEEFLKGRRIDEQTAAEAGELAVAGAKPLSKNAYKVDITKTLVKRGILGLPMEEQCLGGAKEEQEEECLHGKGKK